MGFDLFNPGSWLGAATDWVSGKGTTVDIPGSSYVSDGGIHWDPNKGIGKGSGGSSSGFNAIDAIGFIQGQEDRSIAKGNLDYQRAMNATAMQREDTAVQRRVADLKAAGLSPTLAAGSAAGSAGFRSGDYAGGNTVYDSVLKQAAVKQAQQAVHQSTAQTKLIQSQAAIAQHDASVISRRPNSLSSDPWQVRLGDQFKDDVGKGALRVLKGASDIGSGIRGVIPKPRNPISDVGRSLSIARDRIFGKKN